MASTLVLIVSACPCSWPLQWPVRQGLHRNRLSFSQQIQLRLPRSDKWNKVLAPESYDAVTDPLGSSSFSHDWSRQQCGCLSSGHQSTLSATWQNPQERRRGRQTPSARRKRSRRTRQSREYQSFAQSPSSTCSANEVQGHNRNAWTTAKFEGNQVFVSAPELPSWPPLQMSERLFGTPRSAGVHSCPPLLDQSPSQARGTQCVRCRSAKRPPGLVVLFSLLRTPLQDPHSGRPTKHWCSPLCKSLCRSRRSRWRKPCCAERSIPEKSWGYPILSGMPAFTQRVLPVSRRFVHPH